MIENIHKGSPTSYFKKTWCGMTLMVLTRSLGVGDKYYYEYRKATEAECQKLVVNITIEWED